MDLKKAYHLVGRHAQWKLVQIYGAGKKFYYGNEELLPLV